MTSPTPVIVVGAYGDAYSAPVGTAPPTDLDTVATPWTKLGLISEDGATWTLPTEETTDIGAWQTPYPVRIVTTSLTTSIAFGLMQWDRTTLPFALGGGSFADGLEIVTFKPPKAGEAQSKALFLHVKDGDNVVGIYFPSGRVTEREDTTFKTDEAAILGVTFAIEVTDPAADPYQLLFKTTEFPAAAAAMADAPADAPAEPPAEPTP